jgi:tRNA-2-methylthio-N6-dimethylallyladenosine synthase
VHLPVQSGSDRILRRMKRGHTIDSYFRRIDKLKASSRDIALTTDIIVGFPSETDADFEKTKRAVEYCGFDSAYIFKYSPRPGTPAFEMEDDVTPGEKKLRFLELEKAQKGRQRERLERYLGKTIQVLAEKVSSRSDEDITGHSTCHKLVNFRGSDELVGNVVDVTIREIKANSLFGERC